MGPHPSLAEPAVTEARYLNARNTAFRAWVNSQPQYVIPGVLEEVDAGTQSSLGVHLLEPADSPNLPRGGLAPCGTEPRLAPGLTANQSGLPGHPVPSHSGVVVGAALSSTGGPTGGAYALHSTRPADGQSPVDSLTTTETGANHFPVTRARLQKGL